MQFFVEILKDGVHIGFFVLQQMVLMASIMMLSNVLWAISFIYFISFISEKSAFLTPGTHTYVCLSGGKIYSFLKTLRTY